MPPEELADAGELVHFDCDGYRVGEIQPAGTCLGQGRGALYQDDEVGIGVDERVVPSSLEILDACNILGEGFGTERLKAILRIAAEDGEGFMNAAVCSEHNFIGHNWQPVSKVILIIPKRFTLPNEHGPKGMAIGASSGHMFGG